MTENSGAVTVKRHWARAATILIFRTFRLAECTVE